MRILAFVLLLTAFSPSVLAAPTCPYSKWTQYLGASLLRHPTGLAYIYTTKYVKMDADGAPNAYHPDDIGLHCTRGEGFKSLDCPANAGYPNTSWWPDALVPDLSNRSRAFIQPSGEFAGFFVSQTSLQDTSKSVTDPSKYVDSRNVPYIVFPGKFHQKTSTGRTGDLGYAINLHTGAQSPFVVADIGPDNAVSLGRSR